MRVVQLLMVLGSAAVASAGAQAGRSATTDPSAAHRAAAAPFRCDATILRQLIGHRVDEKTIRGAITERLGFSPIDDAPKWGIDGVAICGREVQLLLHGERIEDAIYGPAHSRRYPQSLGYCTRERRKLPGLIYAVLDNPDLGPTDSTKYTVDDTAQLTPTVAWRVDSRMRKLVALDVAKLKCARFDIFTVDGGR